MLPSLHAGLTSPLACASLTRTLPFPTAVHPANLQLTMPSERRALAFEAAAAHVGALNRAARKRTTPCGSGVMAWRVWGAGEPLVLLHGGYGSWTHWIRAIPELSQHYEVWVPDIPGLGDSAMPPEPWTPASIAQIVAAGLGEVLPPPARPRLVGFSFGGHVATLTAARLGTRLRSLTLIGVAALGLTSEPRAPFAKERTGMSGEERDEVHRHNLGILMFADPARIDDLAVYLQEENVNRARFRSRPFAATDEIARTLAEVTAPLNTIWGTRDVLARPSLDARLAVLRRHHPELQVRRVEGAGHWVMYEAPEAFCAALLDVLGAAP
jgi:2-hydroxy-6-oxonona-2,4-dienedioate hydrolase